MPNNLYFGDNLEILRKEIRSETIDLIYLDPLSIRKPVITVFFVLPTGMNLTPK